MQKMRTSELRRREVNLGSNRTMDILRIPCCSYLNSEEYWTSFATAYHSVYCYPVWTHIAHHLRCCCCSMMWAWIWSFPPLQACVCCCTCYCSCSSQSVVLLPLQPFYSYWNSPYWMGITPATVGWHRRSRMLHVLHLDLRAICRRKDADIKRLGY